MKYNSSFYDRHQEWDRYKHFHWPSSYGHNPFVRFATGELGVVGMTMKPNMRKTYSEYNVAISNTRDAKYKLYTPDGKLIPHAWLHTGGGQDILIDFDTKRVVSLEGSLRAANVPEYLQHMKAAFLRPEHEPIGGSPIYGRPPQSVTDTPERKQWRDTVFSLCASHCDLNNLDKASPYLRFADDTIPLIAYGLTPREAVDKFLYMAQAKQLVYRDGGPNMERDQIMYPYLMIK